VTGANIEVANSHEPSYYEIALTNRQVIVAFVILLVCLLSAFFSGVWIGRESEARAQAGMVRDTPPAATQQAQVDEEGQELEEFEFFDSATPGQQAAAPEASEDRQAEGAEGELPRSSQDTTLLEDLGGEVPPARPAVETPAPREASPVPEPQSRRDRRREREERAALERTPPPAAEPRRAAREETLAVPASAAGKVVIQVFSSPEKDQAEKIRDRLSSGGHKAFLSPVEVAGHTMYRVRIGPFGTRDDAQKVAESVRKGFKLDTWVTE